MQPHETLFFLATILFSVTILKAQRIDTKRPSLNQSHPGVLLTIDEDFPRSPIDGYNLYVSKSCKKSRKKYPMIIFLHGGSLVGGDVARILNWDLPKAILESSSLESEFEALIRDSFIVVMPHISHGEFYEGEVAIRTIIDRLIKNENADSERIYLTGFSRGGYGTWGLASRMSDVFAAVAPICGGAGGITDYNKLEGLPIWVTHNTEDGVVPYKASDRIVKRLETMFGKPFHQSSSIKSANYKKYNLIFTSKESDSHDAWTSEHVVYMMVERLATLVILYLVYRRFLIGTDSQIIQIYDFKVVLCNFRKFRCSEKTCIPSTMICIGARNRRSFS